MKAERKTKTQLIEELKQAQGQLAAARQRINQLESEGRDDALRRQMEANLRASVEQWHTTST